jgi:hypothetical protein
VDEDMLQYYIELGVINVSGMDENGEFIFTIDESAKEIAPELWKAHTDFIDATLIDLFEKGLLDVEYDENLEAHMELSEEGKRVAKELGLIELEE